MIWVEDAESWRFILFRYLPRLAVTSLVWEIAQLPLYTLWQNPHLEQIAFAVAHCTLGDVLIGAGAIVSALVLSRAPRRKDWQARRIVMITISLSLAYTALSERINLALENWAYAAVMPIVPWLEVGLAPLLQWFVVPLVAWHWATHRTPFATAHES